MIWRMRIMISLWSRVKKSREIVKILFDISFFFCYKQKWILSFLVLQYTNGQVLVSCRWWNTLFIIESDHYGSYLYCAPLVTNAFSFTSSKGSLFISVLKFTSVSLHWRNRSFQAHGEELKPLVENQWPDAIQLRIVHKTIGRNQPKGRL